MCSYTYLYTCTYFKMSFPQSNLFEMNRLRSQALLLFLEVDLFWGGETASNNSFWGSTSSTTVETVAESFDGPWRRRQFRSRFLRHSIKFTRAFLVFCSLQSWVPGSALQFAKASHFGPNKGRTAQVAWLTYWRHLCLQASVGVGCVKVWRHRFYSLFSLPSAAVIYSDSF